MTELFMKFIDTNNNLAIRGVVDENGVDYYLSVFDFINNACGRNTISDYGRNLFNRLISDKSDHQSELISYCKYKQFTGK